MIFPAYSLDLARSLTRLRHSFSTFFSFLHSFVLYRYLTKGSKWMMKKRSWCRVNMNLLPFVRERQSGSTCFIYLIIYTIKWDTSSSIDIWQKTVNEWWRRDSSVGWICTYFLLSDNGSIVVLFSYTWLSILSSEICSLLPISDKRQ